MKSTDGSDAEVLSITSPGAGDLTSIHDGRADRQASTEALSQRLRGLRAQYGWTLDDLASRSGVSRSTLSKLERNHVSPTYDVIQRLARSFDLSVVGFLSSGIPRNAAGRRAVTLATEGQVRESRGHSLRMLFEDLSTKRMIPFHATIHARNLAAAGGLVRHSGEECMYVLSGEVLFHTEHYAPVRLKTGDSIYIDSEMGHACVSCGPEDAEVFWVTID